MGAMAPLSDPIVPHPLRRAATAPTRPLAITVVAAAAPFYLFHLGGACRPRQANDPTAGLECPLWCNLTCSLYAVLVAHETAITADPASVARVQTRTVLHARTSWLHVKQKKKSSQFFSAFSEGFKHKTVSL